MSHTLSEAESELTSAAAFGRKPAAWAMEMVDQLAVDEASFEILDVACFGGEIPISSVDAVAAARGGGRVADFQRAGLCEASAERAARGLLDGTYFSFEDAAIAQTVFDEERKNRAATPLRVAEVAATLAGNKPKTGKA